MLDFQNPKVDVIQISGFDYKSKNINLDRYMFP